MNPVLDDLVLAAGSSFPAILAKVTLTSVLALAATFLARRSRASVRHVLLSACFALLLVAHQDMYP